MEPQSVFVYGTLKRGHCREKHWPYEPLCVEPAVVGGILYDLGPYPALLPGTGLVLGELWHFQPEQIGETIAVLDRIEGYDPQGQSLYRREVRACRGRTGSVYQAYLYIYDRRHELTEEGRISPNSDGFYCWNE